MKAELDARAAMERMTLREKIGQMFGTGFPECEMNDSFRALVEDWGLSNVILFRPNLSDKEQTARMCGDIRTLVQQRTGTQPFITIDEEGGIVSRLPDSMGKMPSAMALSSLGVPGKIYEAARVSGEQLRALGINFNLAPVLDVNSNARNPVIGVRSYGQDADTTWANASRAVQGYLDAGVMCSGKHFPGHGDTVSDSHLELPTSKKSADALKELEFVPFKKAIAAGIPAVTIAHVVYEALDELPATMSRRIVSDILRGEMGFDGLIISDCMEMNAISQTYGIEEGAIRAVLAGIELIFISHWHDKVRSTMEALEQAVQQGRVPLGAIDSAVARILHYKEIYGDAPAQRDDEVFARCSALAAELYRETVRPLGSADHFCLGANPCFVSPRQTQVSQASNAEQTLCFAEELCERFGGNYVRIPLRPEEKDINAVLEAAQGASSVVIGTLNATVYPTQMELLQKLDAGGMPLACVTLRNPFELERLSYKTFALPAWEYSARSIARAAEFFRK